MRFGPWYPLGQAHDHAPDRAGVLQARADALLALPRGKSAMVLYAASGPDETLRDFVRDRGAAQLEAAVQLGASRVRFAESTQPEEELRRLLRIFVDRFGAAPLANRGKVNHAQ